MFSKPKALILNQTEYWLFFLDPDYREYLFDYFRQFKCFLLTWVVYPRQQKRVL